MKDSICPVCGKPNSDTVDICQYCGGVLQKSATIPMPTIRPGQNPVKQKTSDLERSLPGWLRDARRASKKDESGSGSQNAEETGATPAAVPAKSTSNPVPKPPKLDLLSGLANLDDENDESVDWLKNLQGTLPASPAQPQEPAPDQNTAAPTNLSTPDPALSKVPFLDDAEVEAPPDVGPDSTLPDSSMDWLDQLNNPGQPDSKPLPSDFAPEVQQATDPSIYADIPDWLASLAGVDSAAGSSQSGAGQAGASDAPDWLASLGGDTFSEESFSSADEQESGVEPSRALEGAGWDVTGGNVTGDTPDWLASLQSPTPSASIDEPKAALPFSTQADETPDWLAGLQSTSSAAPAAEPEASLPSSVSAGEVPDWLASLQSSSPSESMAEQEAILPFSTQADETPDWLASMQSSSQAEPVTAPEENLPFSAQTDEMPDWLASLQSSNLPASDAEPEASHPSSVAAGDMPDWLASLQSSSPSVPVAEPDAGLPVSAQTDETPDWLASSQSSTPLEAAAEPDAPQPLVANDPTPDLTLSVPSSALSQADQALDWLASLQASDSSAQAVEPQAAVPSQADESLDWLASLQAADTSTSQPISADQASAGQSPVQPAADLPDWLASIQVPATVEPGKPDVAFETHQPFVVDSLPQNLPDQAPVLSARTETTPEPPVQAELPASSTAPFVENGLLLPDELEQVSSELAQHGDQSIDSIFSMDTPDWLSGFSPSQTERQPEHQVMDDDDLRPAQLPSWVQAMRPVESAIAENKEREEDSDVENRGPLAGLRSILPFQPEPSLASKSSLYLPQVMVNETQKAQAALLQNLLNSENTPRAVSRRTEKSIDRRLRWIIALILFASILIAAALGLNIFPAAAVPVEGVPAGMFFKTLSALPDGAPVLVILDYQPGFAGEMEMVTRPVIEQLMQKQSKLAFLSTSPFGDLMADRLVEKLAGSFSYQPGMQYVELGYLPGGAGGIKVFADQPRSALGDDTILGNLWDVPALQSVTTNQGTSLSNFSAVIIATDDPDTARLWVEQAQPQLRTTPMLLVVSAQAEPMTRPYLSTGQIQGMVVGLEGGSQYESTLGKPGPAGPAWNAFGVGMLVTELIIIIGGIWGFVSGLRTRRAAMERDED